MNFEKIMENKCIKGENFYFYAADPGAVSILEPIEKFFKKKDKKTHWFFEGWAANNIYKENSDFLVQGKKFPQFNSSKRSFLFMGQQTDYKLANSRLLETLNQNLFTIFVSDHWKDISPNFCNNNKIIIPDLIWVPDDVAHNFQKSNLRRLGVPDSEISKKLWVFGHPGIEKKINKINNIRCIEVDTIRREYNCDGSVIFMVLDPFEEATKEELGFDWKSSLKAAVNYLKANKPEASLLIKAHPRQNIDIIREFVDNLYYSNLKVVKHECIEPFVAVAEEVWGISSLVLIVALKLNKPIRVFVPNASPLGLLHINAHIYPFIETP